MPEAPSKVQGGRARALAREIAPLPPVQTRPVFLEPHVCQVCFSRLVSSDAGAGHRAYTCTNCGAEAVGQDSSALCCCGLTIRKVGKDSRSGSLLINAGIRCALNPSPTPDMPSLYIATEPERP